VDKDYKRRKSMELRGVRVKKEEEVGGEAKEVGVSAAKLERYVKGLEELRALIKRGVKEFFCIDCHRAIMGEEKADDHVYRGHKVVGLSFSLPWKFLRGYGKGFGAFYCVDCLRIVKRDHLLEKPDHEIVKMSLDFPLKFLKAYRRKASEKWLERLRKLEERLGYL
jgi:hypothetical protein